MYTIDDLNVMLLSELKDIGEKMGVKNAKKLAKQDLVYKILDQQALKEDAAPAKKQNDETDRKMRPRRRENVAPTRSTPQKRNPRESLKTNHDSLSRLKMSKGPSGLKNLNRNSKKPSLSSSNLPSSPRILLTKPLPANSSKTDSNKQGSST